MQSHPWTLMLGAAVVYSVQCAPSIAAEPIGRATATQNRVEGVLDGKIRLLVSGQEVFSNELVRTGPNGLADLLFLDNTSLNVGPGSEIRLDQFVYDRTGSSGSVVLQATKGEFRFVTGTQDKRAYQLKTSYGTLGVRGTRVELKLIPCTGQISASECGLRAKVAEGSATLTTNSAQVIELPLNSVVSVTGGGSVSQSTSGASILNFASAAGAQSTATTSNLGGAGGGGGGTGQTNPLPSTGGVNTGSPVTGRASTPVESGFFIIPGGGVGGSSAFSGSGTSSSVSPSGSP